MIIDDIRWAIDNLCATHEEKEEFYEIASSQWGASVKTLRNYVSMARSPIARIAQERELTFDHANVVLGLDPEIAEDLLSSAAEQGWSSARLSQIAWGQKIKNPGYRNGDHQATQQQKLPTNDGDFEQQAEELAGDEHAYNWTIPAYEPEPEEPPYNNNAAYNDDEILARAQEIRAERARERREERVERIQEITANNKELNDSLGVFPVIYADPPWRYEHSVSDSRMIENQYPTMPLADICQLPVSNIATPDAVLFLWATSPKLAEAMQVIESWGFVYRSCIVWDKERIGMGYYARQQHELLLIAARGELPTPEPANRPGSVVRLARSEEHSQKPQEFYQLIERMYPEYSKIELFSRSPRGGWVAWGNQAN